MLKWPTKALGSIATLFQPLQDIDVYVEDEGSEVFYLELLTRLTDGEFKIQRVFPLGGRVKVIDKCRELQNQKRPAVFVIDGDFEWIKDANPSPLKGLYRHDAYCIENYLFCSTAATELITESHGKLTREQVAANLKWSQFLQEIDPLVDLFCTFAAANELAPSIPTVSRGIGSIVTQNKKTALLDKEKVDSLRREVETEALSHTDESSLRDKIAKTKAKATTLPLKHSVVSGKDFLLPLLRFRMSSLAKSPFGDESSFKFRMARHCSLEQLAPLKAALRNAAQGKKLDT